MIESKDRSGYFGASDTDKIIGNWKTATFEKWWMQKIGINRDHFDNQYTSAGTHYEHRILESLGIPMELDKQIIIEDLRLRVNLDGNDTDTIYECKTYKHEKGFKLPKKYINQVQVQMFASEFRRSEIVAYGLVEGDYDNYFNPIDPERLQRFTVPYDEKWINEVYLPKLTYLAECLKEGRFP
ncbi:MAG: hypothetical protein E7629_03680 [Ruminococcaceae bacterium]|nr:hypothetical protein [Oscillospiraceae bacterium]